MSYLNRLHYDDAFAAASELGRLVAPQSFAVCCTAGHGAAPAVQGNIPGSHMLLAGDEWWFSGPRIYPGDLIHTTRAALDYRVTRTRFAGPTVFQRGETGYVNQRGELVAVQRSTAARFLVENARRLGLLERQAGDGGGTQAQLQEIEDDRLDWIRTFHDHVRRTGADVQEGGALPRRVIGPHTVRSLTTEWRSFIFTVWGAGEQDDLGEATTDAGWLPGLSVDAVRARIDPSLADGLYAGAASSHADAEGAKAIGLPKPYGYGASMGAWILDYAAAWAGELGFITHSDVQYRFPALEGDVTYVDGRIGRTGPGAGESTLVAVEVTISNQRGLVLAKGSVDVTL